MRFTTVVSAVLPGKTQLRTGNPSRVTARATTTCGSQAPSSSATRSPGSPLVSRHALNGS